MDWAQRQKIIYSLIFAGIIILLAAYPAYKLISKPATCFDQKQNGTETGVDCGGACARMCMKDVKPLRVVWAKAFPINGSIYDIGAYVENPNTGAGLKSAHYVIQVFDNSGSILSEKKGVVELAPSSRVLLFETGVTFAGTPERVEVTFDKNDLLSWLKATTAPSSVVTKNQSLKSVDLKPRFDAVLVNTDSVNEVTNLTLGAIIYDVGRQPVAVSRTYVDRISKGGEQDVFFTWPSRFSASAQNFITEIVVTPRAIFAE